MVQKPPNLHVSMEGELTVPKAEGKGCSVLRRTLQQNQWPKSSDGLMQPTITSRNVIWSTFGR